MIPSTKVRWGAALIAAVVLSGILGGTAFAAPVQKNPSVLDALREKAWNEGSVRVLVQFQVPQLEELTTSSANFWTADSSTAVTRARNAADHALNHAIEYASWKIVTELQGTDFEETGRFRYIPFIGLKVSPNALAVLEASQDVLSLEEDLPQQLPIPSIENAESTKGGKLTDDIRGEPTLIDTAALVGAKAVWGAGYTGADQYVAFLSTGIRSSHQFFAGKSIIEACRSKGRDGIPGVGDCPNGLSEQNGPNSASHFESTFLGWDEGTHNAGIATGNFGSLGGIAKGANIIAVNVFSKFTSSDCGGSPCLLSWNSDSLAGLEYIYSLRGSYKIAAVMLDISGSFASSFCDSDSRKIAIDLLRSVGIAAVTCTGSNGYCDYIGWPGCISTSVSVGASTKADEDAYYNNWNSFMQRLYAPGSSIYSSTGYSDFDYAFRSGTGYSASHVAGAWALLKQILPNADVTTLLDALRTSGRSIYSICDWYSVPIPRIHIYNAVQYLTATLVIQTSSYGSTDPVPGTYFYQNNSTVTISAIPAQYSTFVEWIGDASGADNPLAVVADRDKTVRANFRYIFAPEAKGVRILNRSFSQAEYINKLSWENSTSNAGLNVSGYRIYLMNGGSGTLLAEVGVDVREYSHRKAGAETKTYHIVALVGSREGVPAEVTIQ